MLSYPIHIGRNALEQLPGLLAGLRPSRVAVLADHNTARTCYPHLSQYLPPHDLLTIPPGEQHKTLDTCTTLWREMTHLQLDRKALLLNLGGGVIGDLGGFVAATYKRGIPFVQIPTTLLSQVDASVGGKLGIDFDGFKNHLGVFSDPQAVFIDTTFLDSLPRREWLSGFAETIKHHLIADREGWEQLRQLPDLPRTGIDTLISHSVQIKSGIVEKDPQERGPRKALNFGHTFGHAIESEWLERPEPFTHGEAIAAGMILESFVSMQRGLLFPKDYREIKAFIDQFYPVVPLLRSDSEAIAGRMFNDKKNEHGEVLCTLLDGIGWYMVNAALSREDIYSALQHYREEYGLD